MEVLSTADYFHDPDVKWRFKAVDDTFIFIVGSEKDRIAITFTKEELQQIFAKYAECQLANAQWITSAK